MRPHDPVEIDADLSATPLINGDLGSAIKRHHPWDGDSEQGGHRTGNNLNEPRKHPELPASTMNAHCRQNGAHRGHRRQVQHRVRVDLFVGTVCKEQPDESNDR